VLVLFIFLIGSKQQLFSTTKEVNAKFVTVSSLKTGAAVEMAGINVGNVTDIQLPKKASDWVRVTMKVEDRAMPLIHTDSRALITTSGLIGDKYIMITVGGDSTPILVPGGTIAGVPPQDFSKIYDTLNNAVSQVNKLTYQVVEILKSVRTGQGTLGKLIYDNGLYNDLHDLTSTARTSVERLTNSFDSLSGRVSAIATKINSGEGSIGKIISSDDLYNDIKATTENVRLSSQDLRDAMSKIALGSGRFAEDAEALKHNFLMKGYFEDRGYWDAPDFELTIDRKLDSLSHLNQHIQEELEKVRMLKGRNGSSQDPH
jgi:phospholipid/cholesterol/gamma-HCH transport system substrate-binding protein